MARVRRSPDDYAEEAGRFESWLVMSEGKTISQLTDIDELVDKVEAWLSSIDVYGSHAGAFAKSLLTHLLSRNLIPTKEKRDKVVQIVRDFRVDRTGSKWLKFEERELRRLYRNKKVTTGYIARELGRTKKSLYSKARRLGVKRPPDALTEREVKKRFAQMNK